VRTSSNLEQEVSGRTDVMPIALASAGVERD